MKKANLTPLIDDKGKQVGFERPANACFDKDGNFIGVPEEGKEVLTGDIVENKDEPKPVELKAGAFHPPTAE